MVGTLLKYGTKCNILLFHWCNIFLPRHFLQTFLSLLSRKTHFQLHADSYFLKRAIDNPFIRDKQSNLPTESTNVWTC